MQPRCLWRLVSFAPTRGFAKLSAKGRTSTAPQQPLPSIVPSTDASADQWMVDMRKENFFSDVLSDPKVVLTPEERDAMTRIGSFRNASDRQLFDRRIQDTIKKYQRFPGDTGSSEVQIAVLSERIIWGRERMLKHRRDIKNRLLLEAYFHQRRRLMKYLKRTRFDKYNLMIADYGITEEEIWEWGRQPGRKTPFGHRYRGIIEDAEERQKRLAREAESNKAEQP